MQVKNTLIKLVVIAAVMIPYASAAQTSSINAFSPYTMYGIGEQNTPGTLPMRSMGGVGVALSEDGRTLYVSDLGNRCIWAVDADARELTAGGKNCGSFVSGLPGYPGALALDEDGILYISYRWTRSGWLEKHADSTLLRGIALRAGENIQKKLFKLPADAPCAEAVDSADGSWKQTFSGRELDGCTAVCPAGSKVYFGAAGSASLLSARV